jgi:hypothetical protein
MFFIIIVLYKKHLRQSPTLQGLLASADLLNTFSNKLVIWDNSPGALPINEIRYLKNEIRNCHYRSTPENLPLSVIYNECIKEGLVETYQYLVLLDDDSHIGLKYFQSAFKAAGHHYELMLPKVINKGAVCSPMRYYILKSFPISNLFYGIMSAKQKMAINSGMIISFSFLRRTGFKYTTFLKNYGTDNYFMRFFSKNASKLYVLDFSFDHSLSFFDSRDIDKKLAIFKETKKINIFIHSDSAFHILLARTYNILSSLKNAFRYKSVKFLK